MGVFFIPVLGFNEYFTITTLIRDFKCYNMYNYTMEDLTKMTERHQKNGIDERKLTVIVFSLFFSWLLAFPFEGRILYGLGDIHNISIQSFVFGTIAAHFIGLLACSFFLKTMKSARVLMLFSIAFCIVTSVIFFLPPSLLWRQSLYIGGFLVGSCVAAWGFYLKHSTPKNERIKTIADGLIYSNILMIILNLTSAYISPYFGLGLGTIFLIGAFYFTRMLPKEDTCENIPPTKDEDIHISKKGPIFFLYLFIMVISINSGLMYQVQGPAFTHLEGLTSWYWALPYIAAIFIMRNLPQKANRAYILYIGIAMIGFSFIFFQLLGRSWVEYLLINTLMLEACGVFDLFWWSILGEMLDLHNNPSKVLGIGLSANVLGVLLGGLIGNVISSANAQSQNSTLLALGIVCITLVLLPPLHKRLTDLIKNHAYLTVLSEKPTEIETENQRLVIEEFNILEVLTERESEIANLLLKGKTYKMIAGELNISENTVKTHVKNIYSKVGVQSRSELMSLLVDIQSITSSHPKR